MKAMFTDVVCTNVLPPLREDRGRHNGLVASAGIRHRVHLGLLRSDLSVAFSELSCGENDLSIF